LQLLIFYSAYIVLENKSRLADTDYKVDTIDVKKNKLNNFQRKNVRCRKKVSSMTRIHIPIVSENLLCRVKYFQTMYHCGMG